MKEIYSFDVEVDTEVERPTEKVVINKETGKEEKVTITKKFTETKPVRVIIKEPNRRQIEEADMEADMMDEDRRWADEFTNKPTEESQKTS